MTFRRGHSFFVVRRLLDIVDLLGLIEDNHYFAVSLAVEIREYIKSSSCFFK